MRKVSFGASLSVAISGLTLGVIAGACGATASTSATGCTTLSSCCATLPESELAACVEVASTKLAASCSEELLTLQTSGFCGSSKVVSSANSSGSSASPSCGALAACCTRMGSTAESQCDSLAMTGVESVCESALSTYTTDGLCGGGASSGGPMGTGSGTGVSTNSGGFTGTGGGFSTGSGGFTTTGSSSVGSTGFASSSVATSAGDAGPSPECTVPTTPPSGGSCVTVTPNDAGTGISCNPVTNGDCASLGAGYACDVAAGSTGTLVAFDCYPSDTADPDMGNTQAVCATCSADGPYCVGGATCAGNGGTTCVKYCCTDADCGAGTCLTGSYAPLAPNLGYCVE